MYGIIQSWHGTFGFIYTTTQRYFFHISEFNAERAPRSGERVLFETKTMYEVTATTKANEKKAGKLPFAFDVRPVDKAAQ